MAKRKASKPVKHTYIRYKVPIRLKIKQPVVVAWSDAIKEAYATTH